MVVGGDVVVVGAVPGSTHTYGTGGAGAGPGFPGCEAAQVAAHALLYADVSRAQRSAGVSASAIEVDTPTISPAAAAIANTAAGALELHLIRYPSLQIAAN
ncbi:hypothetical protein AWH04_25925 [Rhodococcus erythropolis]|nr:hypothetical protein AWH04_25925 [Rhodococcus erythropolis]